MKFSAVRKTFLVVFVVSLIFTSGYLFGRLKIDASNLGKIKIDRTVPDNRQDVNFSLFWHIWDTLETSYYDKSKLNTGKMVYGAISGMVASLGDPYTAFLPPEENKVVEEDLSGAFEGVGIQIGFRGKNLTVISPLPDSPAIKAGIKAGDFIVGIKDEAKKIDTGTAGITLNDAVKMIRGKAGTKLTLLLLRDGSDEPIKIEVERAKLDVPSVVVDFVGNDKNIAHIKLLKFGADTRTEWDKSIQLITNNQTAITKIILDLRNNPGGYLQGSVDIAGEFLNKGSVVVIEERGNIKNEYKTDRSGYFGNKKVVILVNGGSASASEILAGALSETKGYKLIGETTFGKGTIQEPLQLEKGSSLHITTAKWLTPKGVWVNEKGITPDIKVEDKEDTTIDEQLEEAIKAITNN